MSSTTGSHTEFMTSPITDYFMRYYNWRRPHSANEGLPPGLAENQLNFVSKIA